MKGFLTALLLLVVFALFFLAFLIAPALLIGFAMLGLYAFVGKRRKRSSPEPAPEPEPDYGPVITTSPEVESGSETARRRELPA